MRLKSLTTVLLLQASGAEVNLMILKIQGQGIDRSCSWWVGGEDGGPSVPTPASSGPQSSAPRGLWPHLWAGITLPMHLVSSRDIFTSWSGSLILMST